MMLQTFKVLFALALCLSLSNQAGANFIVNGNFEQGNTGFSTQYTYAAGDIGGAASYDVVDDPAHDRPHDIHPVSYGDHTTGQGLMMAVNGAENASTIFWSETLTISSHTNFTFSMWLSSWFGPPVAVIDVTFNGVSIGSPSAPSTVAVWQNFSTTWNSGAATSLTINMTDTNLADIGSDFAVDDISFNATTPEPASALLLLTGLPLFGLASRAGRRSQPI